MAAMGITNVRIAEFAWALMEPKEGSFDFAWLERVDRVLTGMGSRSFSALLLPRRRRG